MKDMVKVNLYIQQSVKGVVEQTIRVYVKSKLQVFTVSDFKLLAHLSMTLGEECL